MHASLEAFNLADMVEFTSYFFLYCISKEEKKHDLFINIERPSANPLSVSTAREEKLLSKKKFGFFAL
jgi:hypothetical protein